MRLALSAPILALLLAGPALAAPNAIAPGYWETTSQVVTPMRSTRTERRCIRPQDVAKFMEGPSNHIYRCTYPTRVIGAGTIRLSGTCATRKGPPLPITGEGTFTRDTFRMEARIGAKLGAMTLPIRAVTSAKRLAADCPAEPAPPAAKPADGG
jgi:hypothetical protein